MYRLSLPFRTEGLLAAIALVFFLPVSCTPDKEATAQDWVDRAIATHRLDRLDGRTVRFDFREHSYSVYRKGNFFVYTRLLETDSTSVLDSLDSRGRFSRHIDGREVPLADSLRHQYSESVNSVAYFVQLPLPLNDDAVLKRKGAEVVIGGQPYQSIEVSFEREGGGTDYRDEFRYWIHRGLHTLDYLAYAYATDGGGVRFRVATVRDTVGGLIFQNYANYTPDSKLTPLDSLPGLWEAGRLKLLSTIENTAIRVD